MLFGLVQGHTGRRAALIVGGLAVVAMLTVVAAGCGESQETTSTSVDASTTTAASPSTTEETATSGPMPAVDKWEIPQLTILTGPAAGFGLDAQWGAEYAAKQINDAGGIRGIPIELVAYDTALDPARAVTEMSKAVEGSLLVLGPVDQGAAEAAGDIAVKAGVAFIGSVGQPDLLQRMAPWGLAVYGNTDEAFPLGVAEWLRLNPDIKSVVLSYTPDDAFQVATLPLIEGTFSSAGIQVLGQVEASIGQLDLGPTAVKALSMNPDGYYSLMLAEEQARYTVELRKRGVSEGRRICAGPGADGSALYDVGGTSLDGTYLWEYINVTSPDTRWTGLVEAYSAEKGAFPYSPAVTAHYDAVLAIQAAIEALEITGDPTKLAEERVAVRDYLRSATDLQGAFGTYGYVDGMKSAPRFMFQINNAKPEFVSEF